MRTSNIFRTWCWCKMCPLAPSKKFNSIWQQRQPTTNKTVGPKIGTITCHTVSIDLSLPHMLITFLLACRKLRIYIPLYLYLYFISIDTHDTFIVSCQYHAASSLFYLFFKIYLTVLLDFSKVSWKLIE